MSQEGQDKIYTMVTEQIMDALKNGTVPWRKPWTAAGYLPTSMSSRKPYRGVNVFLLAMKAMAEGWGSPFWGTYDHIAEAAGMVKVWGPRGMKWTSPDGTPRGVRAGEKSTIVIFWKKIMVDDKNSPGDKKPIFMLRYYRVFNACQADGLPERFFPSQDASDGAVNVLESAETIVKGYLANGGPELIKVAGDEAHYQGITDMVTMPKDEQFPTAGQRYAATFHELTHSTGHADRLNRPGITEFDHFGSGKYAQEELVAEMGSAMLAGVCGIDSQIGNSAAYIENWLGALGRDHKLVIKAAAQAQRAADLIRGITHTDKDES
jgi:antirestriction protein ArdC